MRGLLLTAMLAMPLLALAETHVVTIEGMKYQPATLTVKRGDQVTWQNRDVVPHTATASGKFDSGAIAAGKSWTWTAAKAGSYDYVCTYHPGMKAGILVR